MKACKRILVVLDGGTSARHVLEDAIDLARRYDARLTLMRAVAPLALSPHAVLVTAARVTSREDEAWKEVNDSAALVPPELFGDVVVRSGTPWQAICDQAIASRAELVVMAAPRGTVLDRIFGTTCSHVVGHTACPVMVSRDPDVRRVA